MFYLFRKSFFVKPKLLFKYVMYALLTVFLTSVCVFLVMRRTIYHTDALSFITDAEIGKVQSALMSPFWWIVGILIVIIGIQSLIRFHKIVGPIYALERIIVLIKNGQLGGHIYLRKGDELKDLAKGIEDMSNTLKGYIEKDREKISEIISEIDKISNLGDLNEIKNRLSELKKILPKITSDFQIK